MEFEEERATDLKRQKEKKKNRYKINKKELKQEE